MKRFLAAAALILFAGCAILAPQPSVFDENEKRFQNAANFMEHAKFREARELYLSLASSQPAVPHTEEATYKAAYILIRHKNPDKDYARAAREFEAFLIRFPASALAESARTWVSMLQNFEESAANKFIQEAGALAKKLEEAQVRRYESEEQRNAAIKERDSLLSERTGLTKRLDALLIDKDNLLREMNVLVSAKDTLIKEKAILEKRADVLTREKESLIQTKTKLEQDLHDLKMLDVKMEKKRKKVK